MDSHRRHELEHNTLFQALSRLPAFAAEYGAYILLGLAVLVALYFYFSTRSTAALQEREAEAVGLYSMGLTVDTAREYRDRVARLGNFITRDDVATQLADFASEFEAYSMLPATSQRPGIRARSLRLRGDFNWTLAAFGGIAHGTAATQAATQPITQPATEPAATTRPDDSQTQAYLAAAETAYREVVDKYPQQTADSLAATFGLAAIAEQRGEFAAARTHYDAVLEREDAPEGPKTLARQRKAMLEILSLHPRLAKPLPPATQPTTTPSTAPATQPAVEPATNPAAPATQPVQQ